MSAQTVDVVRSVYDNFAKGDIPAVLATLAPSVEWVEGGHAFLPHRGTHRTPQAVADKVFGMAMSTFEEFAVVPERFHDAGDTVVVEGRAVGVTKAGRRLDAPACWVWTVRGDQATANHNYHDTDAWREALAG
jgi:uncharacterized protein